MTRKVAFSFLSLIVTSLLLYGAVYIEKFTVKSDNSNITIEWKTAEENNVDRFELERSSANSENFLLISSVPARGSNSEYHFVDRTAYKTEDALYAYRLKIIDKNPSVAPVYTNSVSVTHKVSSVKSTWGSIKSMFR
jgi:hypothetical protein